MSQPHNSLKFSDGTVLENSGCKIVGHILYCWVENSTLEDCFPLFVRPDLINEITAFGTLGGIIYRGFNSLQQIMKIGEVPGPARITVQLASLGADGFTKEEFLISDE